jgi:hypothetical protein
MNTRLLCLLLLAVLLLGGCGSRPDYVASPFFSEAAFREVHPGMDGRAVRGLLGYPVSRFGPVAVPGKGSKIAWHYTVPVSSQTPMRFHSFEVTFGRDGLVSGTLTCEASWAEGEGASDSIQAVQQCRRSIGDIVLRRPDGSTNWLHAGQPGLYVVLLDGDGSHGPRLNRGPNWLADALPELLQKGTIAGVKHLYVGHNPEAYGQLVRNLPAETAQECYVDTEPEFKPTVWDRDSRLLLYKAGGMWSVPGITSANGDLVAEDQKWLVHRLGADGGIANGSQPIRSGTNRTSSAAGSRR